MQKHKSLILIVGVLGLLTALVISFQSNRGLMLGKLKNVTKVGQPAVPKPDSDTALSKSITEEAITLEQARKIAPAPEGISNGIMLPYQPDEALEIDERVYEKSASYDLVVQDVSKYMQQIKEYILSIDGRVLTSAMGTSNKYHYGYMYVKVPVAKFEESTTRVTTDVERIFRENINAQDRTGAYASATSALDKLKEQKLEKEIQLEEAKTNAEKKRLELAIERLTRQIESAEKRLKSEEARVEYANLTLSVADNARYFDPRGIKPLSLQEELQAAWDSVSNILIVLARLAIWTVVYGLLWLPAVVIVRWLLGHRKRVG